MKKSLMCMAAIMLIMSAVTGCKSTQEEAAVSEEIISQTVGEAAANAELVDAAQEAVEAAEAEADEIKEEAEKIIESAPEDVTLEEITDEEAAAEEGGRRGKRPNASAAISKIKFPDPGPSFGGEAEFREDIVSTEGLPYKTYVYNADMTVDDFAAFNVRYTMAMKDMGFTTKNFTLPKGCLLCRGFSYNGSPNAEMFVLVADPGDTLNGGKGTFTMVLSIPTDTMALNVGNGPKGLKGKYTVCVGCNGTGRCAGCGGIGRVKYATGREDCVNCKGSGKCSICGGTGQY